jgi:predicted ATPase
LPAGTSGIDLQQLDESVAMQKTVESRGSLNNYGRLDDQEFESFAKALCVAETLPSEGAEGVPSRITWTRFRDLINAIIEPKEIIGLSREHPETLRVRTPSGHTHRVPDLSSGERQALIIMSRVLRAGAGHSLVLIDEPDAYLHPNLSRRLMNALAEGTGADGQLIVATHSPSILDSLPPEAIVRFSHDGKPTPIEAEPERARRYARWGVARRYWSASHRFSRLTFLSSARSIST